MKTGGHLKHRCAECIDGSGEWGILVLFSLPLSPTLPSQLASPGSIVPPAGCRARLDWTQICRRWQWFCWLSSSILQFTVQEAQPMLTNPHDAFRGQSRSPNTVLFHMLGIDSSCAIVILSLRHAGVPILNFKKCDLEIRVRGHSRSLKMVPFDRMCMISY